MSDDLLGELARQAPRVAFPAQLPAMLATLTDDRFSDPAWLFERKWDGVRCLAHRPRRGATTLLSRNYQRLDHAFPELADAVRAQSDHTIVLDGEIVAFRGRHTSFERLQGRLGLGDEAARASGIAVYYYVFDLLHLDGRDVRPLPLRERKRLLRAAINFTDPLRFTAHRNTNGEEEYRKACQRGDEGVVAKRAAAAYRGGRSPDWLKFKCVRDQELVVGGWTDPKGSRTGLGALLVGYFDGEEFVYAGKVGTGFTRDILSDLRERLDRLPRHESPFTAGRAPRAAHWVEPELVAQIGFTEWTRDGLLRHPRYAGLRIDKRAADVVRES